MPENGMNEPEDSDPKEMFGPFIDRTFRLVEMIGIIALLALALARQPRAASIVTVLGELLAVIYWLEPTTGWLVQKLYGKSGPKARLLVSAIVVLLAALITIGTVPVVRDLTESLKRVL